MPTTTTDSLRWVHLAATICLSKGTTVPADSSAPPFNLIDHLMGLGPTALFAACKPNQHFDTANGLFAQVSEVPKAARCGYYGDNDGGGFKLKLRGGTFAPYISPEGVLLAWPLAGDAALAQAYDDAEESVPAWVPIPAVGGETSHADGLYLEPMMRAADDAVAPYSPDREAFDKARQKAGGAREWLVQRAADYGGGTPPASFDVVVDAQIVTTDTAWSLKPEGGLLLTLGWLPPPGYTPAGPGDGGPSVGTTALIPQWPCGSYRGFGPHPCP